MTPTSSTGWFDTIFEVLLNSQEGIYNKSIWHSYKTKYTVHFQKLFSETIFHLKNHSEVCKDILFEVTAHDQ